jgi:hypothetical protein
MGSEASSDAADAQVAAAQEATAAQKEMYYQTRSDLSPWRAIGGNAITYLAKLMGVSTEDWSGTYDKTGAATTAATTSSTRPKLTDYVKKTTTGGTGTSATGPDYDTAFKNWIKTNVANQAGWSDSDISSNETVKAAFDKYYSENYGSTGTGTTSTEYDYDAYQTALDDYEAAQAAEESSISSSALGKSGTMVQNLLGLGDEGVEGITNTLSKLPGYQFQLEQGTKAVNSNAAAKGSYLSGGTLKALTEYGQGLGETSYRNYLNDVSGYRNTELNRLMSMAGLGQTSSTNSATGGSSYSSGISNSILSGGNARASGYINSANALTGGMNSLSNSAMLSSLLNGGSSGSGSSYYSGDSSSSYNPLTLYGYY